MNPRAQRIKRKGEHSEDGRRTLSHKEGLPSARSPSAQLMCCTLTDLQLKHWCVDDFCSMALEAGDDSTEDSLTNGHLLGAIVPCALGRGEGKKSKEHVRLEVRSGRQM